MQQLVIGITFVSNASVVCEGCVQDLGVSVVKCLKFALFISINAVLVELRYRLSSGVPCTGMLIYTIRF
jgi:hypothetical protein